jgi:hypothetical protein
MPKVPSIAEVKAFLDRAKAYKEQFTGGFYHGSPSPNIKAFDPSKSKKGEEFITPGITFVTPKPQFAESFLNPGSKPYYSLQSGELLPQKSFKTGSTMYPVSVNMGKHFDPSTPEGEQIVKDYLAKRYAKEAEIPDFDEIISKKHEHMMDKLTDPINNWRTLESPSLIQHLKDTGHDTFSVTEGGIKNVGIFEPHNIRGKFAEYNPDEAMNPDFMKAAGGSIVKKALEHAKQIPFVHFSKAENISRLEPAMYGTGIKGAEGVRLQDAPDIKPRSYFYIDKTDVRPEQGLGSVKYSGVSQASYPLHEDPAGYYKLAKELAKDPYFAKQGTEIIDRPKMLNEVERAIKNAGYTGYHTDEAGILFHPTDVQKIQSKSNGGSVFDPQGEDYDYQTATAYGMGPNGTGDNAGHWGSVAPTSDDERVLHDLPEDSYVVLKGKSHPTFHKAEAAEEERGSKIVKAGDRYYSVPK